LFIANSLVQNLPNETTQAVSNGPDRLLVFQARLQALKDDFKKASLDLDCGVCAFMEQPPQSAVAFGRTATAVSPAVTSSPGQTPTQEDRAFCEGNTSAVGPISARIC
jgi:hypothetical protein